MHQGYAVLHVVNSHRHCGTDGYRFSQHTRMLLAMFGVTAPKPQ